jgi:hypothetical protein
MVSIVILFYYGASVVFASVVVRNVVIRRMTVLHGVRCEKFCSWDRPSLDMELIYVTNQMQLLIIFIDNNALHVSDVSRPSSGARELCVQPMVLAY